MAHTLHKLDLALLKAVTRVLTGRVRGLMRLAFLATKNVEMIAAGRQPSKRTDQGLDRTDRSPSFGPRKKKLWASDSPRRLDHFRTSWPSELFGTERGGGQNLVHRLRGEIL
jgi:hypothetical protein